MEQQLAARPAERQVAQFIDDDEIVAQQLLGQAATATGRLFLFELVNQIDQVEEASSRARARMTAEATPMQRWVLPVPVPPMKMALRLASRNAPVASLRTCTSVLAHTNFPRTLRQPNAGQIDTVE
jgi:hypothetical protein